MNRDQNEPLVYCRFVARSDGPGYRCPTCGRINGMQRARILCGKRTGKKPCGPCRDEAVPVAPSERLKDVTACITSFLRPESLKRLTQSLATWFPKLAIDIEDTRGNLSAGRNRLARRCKTPFLWLLEDDFVIRRDTRLDAPLSILAHVEDVGVVCGRLNAASGLEDYANDMRLFRGVMRLSQPPAAPVRMTPEGAFWRYCDCGFNFFLARADVLRDCPWDEDLELHEHAAWFWRLKQQAEWRVAFTPQLLADHLQDRPNPQYAEMRYRAASYRPVLKYRYGISRIETERAACCCHQQRGFAFRGRGFATPDVRRAARQAAMDFARNAGGVFPICGTLLGMVREGDVIPHDRDVDFGCFEFPDLTRLSKYFARINSFHNGGEPCELAFLHHTGVKVDLFRFFPGAGDERYFVIYPDEFPDRPTITRRFPADLLKLHRWKQWGARFDAFACAPDWLEANYGPGWRIPDQGFTYEP